MASIGDTALHPLDGIFGRFSTQLPAYVMQAMNLVNARLYGFYATALGVELADNPPPVRIHEVPELLRIQFKQNASVELPADGCDPLQFEIPLKATFAFLESRLVLGCVIASH